MATVPPDTRAAKVTEQQEQRWQLFSDTFSPERQPDIPATAKKQILHLWGASEFSWAVCSTSPNVLTALLHSGLLHRSLSEGEMEEELAQLLAESDSEEILMSQLRQFRKKHLLRIIFRDLNRLAPMTETTADISIMADTCIQQSYNWLHDDCCKQLGTPTPHQKMTILGMGKLGAGELNLSSDIDLIFCYPEKGETRGAKRVLTNQEFFTRLGQRLIRVLDATTAEGFVFRVDMRLRPYGQSGALALSYSAMEQYYQDQGRDWERYAMIKARVITGGEAANELMQMLHPFVFRRYIDFSAITALRDMKRMIQQEVARRSIYNNIKLGHGGIREIEFIVQSFQLIHGGRDRSLQVRALLTCLDHLENSGYLPQHVCMELREANEFLRNVEHALQAWKDKQTQTLPSHPDEQFRLALAMGFTGWDDFVTELDRHRNNVDRHFSAIVSEAEDTQDDESHPVADWDTFWNTRLDKEEEVALLNKMGFLNPDETHRRLTTLRDGKVLKTVRRQSAERISQFMPCLLKAVLREENPDQALQRLLTIVEAVLRRTAYLMLLIENPGALEHLVSLCSASPWITEQVARHPALLDEFLNLGNLYTPPEKAQLEDELRQQLAHIPEDDLEIQMESLRYFRMAHMLRVAAAQVVGKMPLMKESDYLTWTAETILCAVQDIAQHQLTSRHGSPGYKSDEPKPGFLIVGYGKLGGIELGPGSDLDLVFIHNSNPNAMTAGERQLDNSMFFTRLGQRIVHMLSTSTMSGQLYEVDMRLRPSGNSGLLVSSLTAFEKYQQKEAWTWEHQALVRARCVAGSPELAKQFETVRAETLSQPRDLTKLQKEVREMRHKMVKSLGTKSTRGGTLPTSWTANSPFHLKHDHGGIVDIEFIVQFAVLAWSHTHPALTRWTDNIRILEELADAKLVSVEHVQQLSEAYKVYRKTLHRQALQNLGSQVSGDQMHSNRKTIISFWNMLLDDEILY
ncbi:bifunctional [glutamate--ammonia ligase]-adenylyl-L-tyrosine phosphorylase/[glutamate--ammonia-ligase] adenylyltransferase [Sansalvadorimonas verongulae]|uniref:bifunctional [glutamate--ammonia ligase]-adenylyl-L-tyrosine phosphorylase/[glutamate--ammonia-ligase] adenylyltransferase n=1 Tax=Sansalvadorimonas verongulae TaxID=2172824 RepID=UPI0012BB4DA0|nr:bifunctional [glutamate--ammonia ligase]-adenylyl-L-tyrosine phosphorylase/[glutamate--ammonia-ligase] adenylyltransferase [Sansalvadorimonas verongulae]MTI15285.1 bifunctional [glutamate--ammonia ligase]-adenylyl-L-tyrosine phosphorylase/[glutamate--ammonia-ligase] adenylyltransferase [Sansalvadorimonas verongulae]